MKPLHYTFIWNILIFFLAYSILAPEDKAEVPATSQKDSVLHEISDSIKWDLFTEAVIWVESRGNDSLMGKNNDGGCLQITPVTIAEANRIGCGKYSLNDRFDRRKSIEIWNTIQDYHNKKKDFNLALKIWNPKAPLSYHKKVINKYHELHTRYIEN